MTETRRAVPKGAALFISLFLPVSRLSSCSAARPTRSPLLHAPHLLPLPPPETAKDLPACPRLPILHLPAGSSARQTTATGTPLSAPPLPALIAASPPNVIVTARNSRLHVLHAGKSSRKIKHLHDSFMNVMTKQESDGQTFRPLSEA